MQNKNNNILMKIENLLDSIVGRICIILSFTFPVLNNVHIALILLLAAFIADFFTGWWASYVEIKNGIKSMPVSGYSLESTKARESVTKGIGYILLIMGSVAVEYMFFDRRFTFESLSKTGKDFGVTELVIGFCFSIEFYSAVFENLKRAGFDIVKKVNNGADSIWSMINKVKGKSNG